MIDEEVIFGLVQTAKDQQAAVEKATLAMNTQRGELYTAITQLKNMQANVAAEARKGAKEGLSGITTSANSVLTGEVDKARKTINDVAESLRVRAFAKSLEWICGCLVVGCLAGVLVSWFMWGRNTSAAVNRLDSVNAALERQLDEQMQQQAKKPATPQQKLHTAKPPKQSGPSEPQQEQP